MDTMPTPTFPERPAKPALTPADAFAAIGRGKPTATELAALSDLSRAGAREFASVWPRFPEESRHSVLRRLAELAETNVEHLFGRVYRVALSDVSPVARQLAISALWEDEGSDLIELFATLLESDPSPDVRAESAAALGRFAELATYESLNSHEVGRVKQTLYAAAFTDDQPDHVRRRALESISIFGDLVETQSLISEFFDSDDTATKASAIFAMGRSLNRRWLPTVIAELGSDDSEIRYEAARAAGELGHVDAVEAVSGLVRDPDPEIRHAAIISLGKMGGPGAVRILRALVDASPEADAEIIEDALAEASLGGDMIRAQS